MKHHEIDYLILGGGCSALSFATELIKNNIYDYTFLIVEQRKKYEDDRSWCFWQNNNDIESKLISKSWKTSSFSLKGNQITHNSNNYYYQYIRSIDFYLHAKSIIKKSVNVNLALGEKVLKISNLNNKYLVYTNKKIYIANNILDTRPKKNIYVKSPFLFQSFLGYEIIANNNRFDSTAAYIMESMRYEKNNFLFDYILPIKKNRFLVEVTFFSKSKITSKKLDKILLKSLITNKFKNYKIIRKEYGVIPMGFINKNTYFKNNKYFYAGSIGGAVRPSSGYAFLRIQEWAKKSAINLKENGKPISHPKENIIVYFLDRIFLGVLEKNLSSAPLIFFIFLKRINSKSFFRFMIGVPTLLDYLKVVLSMPKKYFLNKIN